MNKWKLFSAAFQEYETKGLIYAINYLVEAGKEKKASPMDIQWALEQIAEVWHE